MSLVVFNKGGKISVTPDPSATLDLTIAGRTYSVDWDTDVDTTIDNFVAARGQEIADDTQVYIEGNASTATTLDLYNVRDFEITSDNASVGSATVAAQELGIQSKYMLNANVVTDVKTVRIDLEASEFPSANDVLTLTFVSETDRKKYYAQLREIQKNTSGVYDFGVACKAALS